MVVERKKKSLISVSSVIYLLFAICLILGVCGRFYPEIGEKLRTVIEGSAESPVREAFGVLTEGLGKNEDVKDVLSRSYEVLRD